METNHFWMFFVIAIAAGISIGFLINNAGITGNVGLPVETFQQAREAEAYQPPVAASGTGFEVKGGDIGVSAQILGQENAGVGQLAVKSWGWGFTGVRGATNNGSDPASIGVAGSAYCKSGQCTGGFFEWWSPTDYSVSAKLGYKDDKGAVWAGVFEGPVKIKSGAGSSSYTTYVNGKLCVLSTRTCTISAGHAARWDYKTSRNCCLSTPCSSCGAPSNPAACGSGWQDKGIHEEEGQCAGWSTMKCDAGSCHVTCGGSGNTVASCDWGIWAGCGSFKVRKCYDPGTSAITGTQVYGKCITPDKIEDYSETCK